MRFIKLVRFDLVHGIFKMYRKYLLFILLVIPVFIDFQTVMLSAEYTEMTLGDCFFYIYGGAKEYIPVPGEAFQIPYLWLLNHLMILYFTLNYMSRDLQGFGQQIILRCEDRYTWWFPKCIWQIAAVLFYYLAAWGCLSLLCAAAGVKMDLNLSAGISYVIDFGPEWLGSVPRCMLAETIILPALFTAAQGCLQMTASLFVKPAGAYIISAVICISSSYRLHPLLTGNYSMAARSGKVIGGGWDTTAGAFILLAVIFAAAGVGAARFRRYNILERG